MPLLHHLHRVHVCRPGPQAGLRCGDRFVVGALWLALALLPVQRYVHSLAAFVVRALLPRYVLLSTIALAWSWATCRFRCGGGPFHIVRLGIWRGYPFPFEDWILILNPSPISSREFHWLGLIGDALIPAVVLFTVLRSLQRSRAPVEKTRAFLLVGFTVAFVWLNVDYWIGGLPLTWIGSQSDLRFMVQARRGFPFPYDGVLPSPVGNGQLLRLMRRSDWRLGRVCIPHLAQRESFNRG